MTRSTLNFDRLLKLRLIVARFGEMDLAKWWNTRGQLLSAECVRDKTMPSRFFRVRTPSLLPTSTRISTGHKRAW
jgi:hypothetical protein